MNNLFVNFTESSALPLEIVWRTPHHFEHRITVAAKCVPPSEYISAGAPKLHFAIFYQTYFCQFISWCSLRACWQLHSNTIL